MRYEILPDHGLRIYCSQEEQGELQRRHQELLEEDRQGFGSVDESDALERMIANSELEWIPEGSTGDLTSAPMLGITQEMHASEAEITMFGKVNHSSDYYGAIIARWCYMSYQIKSFLNDLADKGECFWEGGYAEGMRPDAVESQSTEQP